MQINIHYGARPFGKAYDNGDFDVAIEKATWPPDSLKLGIRFAKPTSARGANWEIMGWFRARTGSYLRSKRERSLPPFFGIL